MNGNNRKALITAFLIIMVSCGWGFSFLAIAVLVKDMEPFQLLAARWALTGLFFLILVLTGLVKVKIDFRKKSTFFLLCTGLFEPCAYDILETYGIKMSSLSVSAIFVATIPCMTLIIGILFFKHKTDLKLTLSLIVTFVGVAIATLFSSDLSTGGTKMGMLLMLFAVIAASLYSLFSKGASEDYDATSITTVMVLESAVVFNVIALVKGYGLNTYILPFQTLPSLISLLYLSFFCAFASYFCYNKLLSFSDPALANNLVSSISTIVGVVSGILITHDAWGWYTVVGLTITLVGVWMSSRRMREDL